MKILLERWTEENHLELEKSEEGKDLIFSKWNPEYPGKNDLREINNYVKNKSLVDIEDMERYFNYDTDYELEVTYWFDIMWAYADTHYTAFTYGFDDTIYLYLDKLRKELRKTMDYVVCETFDGTYFGSLNFNKSITSIAILDDDGYGYVFFINSSDYGKFEKLFNLIMLNNK